MIYMRKLTLIKPAIYIYSIGFVCFFMQQYAEEKLLAANLMTILFFVQLLHVSWGHAEVS